MSSILKRVHSQAQEAVNSGQYIEAERLCGEILERDKTFSDAWFLKAMSHAGRLDTKTAIACLIEALKLNPNNTEYLAQFAKLCVLVNENRRALLAADHAIKQHPESALTLDTLGVVFTKLGEYSKARDTLSLAVKKSPKNAQFHFNLASAEQFIGNTTAASEHYLEAINIKPKFARAHWALSELRKNVATIEHVQQLEHLLNEKGLSDDDELYLSHALSREKEKQGDYKAAFELLERGKFRYRSKLNYSWVVDQRLFNAISEAFPVNTRSVVEKSLGSEAIFVLGMPRSGTTVVERILSSHSQVESLGEIQNFAIAVKQESGTESHLVIDPSVAAKTGSMNMSKLGQSYLGSLHNRNNQVERFVDKTPLNFLQLGYIAEALPAAKIILVRRNPMDTCLSNFRQLFAVSFSYYNYHYDLVDTGQYFRLFDKLMTQWLSLYGDRIHVLDYESLIATPDEKAKELLHFCELDWEPECLSFHKNSSAVATASAMQVREPLYNTSLARWKKYEEQLTPLKEIFDKAGIEY